MSFEKFTKNSRRNTPCVTISKQGDIRLNMSAVRTYDLANYAYVGLYWDANSRRVGMKPTNDESEPYTYRIRCVSNRTTWVISAMAFMTYIGFDYSGIRTFMLNYDEESDLLVFDTNQ